MKTLILYTTLYGATKSCAEELAGLLGEADLLAVSKKARPDLSAYDGVIVGSPVYMNALPKPMKQFLDAYEFDLLEKKLGIFLCCSNAKRFEKYLPYCFSFDLLEKAEVKECFGGILEEDKLRFWHRMITRAIRKQASAPPPEAVILHENIKKFAALWKGEPYFPPEPEPAPASPAEEAGGSSQTEEGGSSSPTEGEGT